MEYAKQRKWYVLAMIMVLAITAMLAMMPAGTVYAEGTVGWTLPLSMENLSNTKTIEVEVGQKFYISDFLIEVQCGVFPTPVSPDRAVYSSSDNSIASVKKGCVTAKKTGTAKITAKFQKKKYVCTLKVVKRGKLGSATTYKKMNTLANKIASAYTDKSFPTKITSKNFLTLAKAVTEYRALAVSGRKKLNGDRGYLLKTNKLAVPLASKITAVESDLREYAEESVWPKLENLSVSISKVSAKAGGSSFTITLKHKLSQAQFYLLAFYYLNADRADVSFGKKPCITVKESLSGWREWKIVDEFGNEEEETENSDGYVLYTIKPGTAKITASYYKNSKCTRAQKLIRNMKYTIHASDGSGGEYTFSAK